MEKQQRKPTVQVGQIIVQLLRRAFRDSARLRATVIPLLAYRYRLNPASRWIAVVMYHDVPPGAEASFAAQLRMMRNYADFIDLDSAVSSLGNGDRLGGRYVCVTFDDGYIQAFQRALPILQSAGVPSAHFVVPAWIGQPNRVSWDDCRTLLASGCIVGSHTLTHKNLATLDDAQAAIEMRRSRCVIQAELREECQHFACPWGQPGNDYLVSRDPAQAQAIGYRSFLTTIRGRACEATDPFAIPRIRLEPGWGSAQLRYALLR